MSRRATVDESVSAEETDSGEKMSTTDEVDSHNWSDEDESKDELEHKSRDGDDSEEATGSEESDEDTDQDKFSASGASNDHRNSHKDGRGTGKRVGKRKRLHQSDTETRKLLDDVGDDEDYAYLDEAKENSQIDPRFFEMSDEQLNYYTKCFLHLQRKTQSQASLNGAVSGADDRVVEFFRKSQLDTRTLSRVWALADINEDGFLNHSEFMLAMHLVVLHVKGNVPVPSRLPSPVRPCITPNRLLQPVASDLQNSTASSTLSSTADNASTSRGSEPQQPPASNNPHFHHFQPRSSQQQLGTGNLHLGGHHLQASMMGHSGEEGANPKHHSLSDDHLHVYAQRETVVADFSDAPPVLVDSRPTALNATTSSTGFALLNSLASRGPPPRPPPRQYNTSDSTGKGHGRSASLDLNTLAAVTGQLQKPNPSMFHSATTSQRTHATTMSVDESSSASAFTSTSNQFFSQTPPAPPQRPFQQQRVPDLYSRGTQTDQDESSRQPSLDENTFAALLEGAQKMSPAERCRVLRLYNAELENERATLAQIRLQLQLRLDEAEEALRNHGVQVEPLDESSVSQSTKMVASPKPTTV